MCGICGIINIKNQSLSEIDPTLKKMNQLLSHRGPDAEGMFISDSLGLANKRLKIIDLISGDQPITDSYNRTIIFNGQIYNYLELKDELNSGYSFKTNSDTEVILAAYNKWGNDCVIHLKGMFSFAIWDTNIKKLFCARDRFGIKPFYYSINNDILIFASEPKAILPFIENEPNVSAIKDYLTFQFPIDNKTFYKNIFSLLPAHSLTIENKKIKILCYWKIKYSLDFDHTKKYFIEKTTELILQAIKRNTQSDVGFGTYLSGGIDSSIVSLLSNKFNKPLNVYHGTFKEENFKEDKFVDAVVLQGDLKLNRTEITSNDFISNIKNVIYALDFPIAGPGSFPQYMVSKSIKGKNKVVLGGQGGDEIFGGYTRYLIAYFEQCIKGALEGTKQDNFIVTYESIIPNLSSLNQYIPLLKEFWSSGLFEGIDKRYFRLINKANNLTDIIDWEVFNSYSSFDTFNELFWSDNIEKTSYFDLMTHFDFKTLLSALLHVEDRMSMAHSIESRVPFLDIDLIEFLATIPSNIKFENGKLKTLLKESFSNILPSEVLNRTSKMGFPVPLNSWMKTDLKEFVGDIFSSQKAKERFYLKDKLEIDEILNFESAYSRNLWGLLSLELWQQIFIDK